MNSQQSSSSNNTPSKELTPQKVAHPKFALDKNFIEKYTKKKPQFGFNILGEIVYHRSYSRLKEDGQQEKWYETVERVVNGCFNMQICYKLENNMENKINLEQMQEDAQNMYNRIFSFKFLPPGRGLWAMGTKITEQKKIYAALNNCAFVSTAYQNDEKFAKPFSFLMDMSMLGVGVGFDTKGSGSIAIKEPIADQVEMYKIPDSREGWVESTSKVLRSYFVANSRSLQLDYSEIRPEGQPLKVFGGISPGPQPLISLHNAIRQVLQPLIGNKITTRAIVDIMNMIGKCVISGNIRRSAEIAFGEPNDPEFLGLKDYVLHPERAEFGWSSNNSILATIGMDYSEACKHIKVNGEPGFAWLDNMRNYGRMIDPPDYKDKKAQGGNPCLEQTLESYEMCCLVEAFPHNHTSYEDFQETLKYGFLYAKTVTLGLSHWEETNEVLKRNRRIGCSVSGITQFISEHKINKLQQWLDQGYKFLREFDKDLSKELQVNQSIKITSVKPSGTVSLLAGATPGVHYPQSQFYIRRIRVGKNDELVPILQRAGYKLEQCKYASTNYVVEVPVSLGKNIRTLRDVSMWEQLNLTSFMQKYWADNQVSCTITFNPKTEGTQLTQALDLFQYQLKGISFLPKLDEQAYPQMPYEEITEDKYNELIKDLQPLQFEKNHDDEFQAFDPDVENYCDGETCLFKQHKK